MDGRLAVEDTMHDIAPISTRRRTWMAGAWNKSHTLSCVMSLLSRTSSKRPTDEVYIEVLRANHGELLDLFFARLLPSGTGDFGIGPSQLREKQTNPIMLLPYPLTGCFFLLLHRPRLAITAHFDGPDFNSPMYADCKDLENNSGPILYFCESPVRGPF